MKNKFVFALGITASIVIISNFYTSSYVVNYGNYPIWWNAITIIVFLLLILAITRIIDRKKEFNWKLFFTLSIITFVLTELYLIKLIV